MSDRIKFLIFAGVCSMIIIAGSVFAQQPPSGDSLNQAALQWLELIDSEKYNEAWDLTSSHFKKNEDRRRWVLATHNFRKNLGKVKSRSLSYLTFIEESKNAPATAELFYVAEYENALVPQEIIFLVMENKTWRVTGYYAR